MSQIKALTSSILWKKNIQVDGRKAMKFYVYPSVAYTQCESHFFEWKFSDQFSLKVLVW